MPASFPAHGVSHTEPPISGQSGLSDGSSGVLQAGSSPHVRTFIIV